MVKIRNLQQTTLSDNWTKLTDVSFEQQEHDGRWSKQRRETYHNRPAVAVLPYDKERKTVLLIKQFRAPAYLVSGQMAILEACAGLIDAGETDEQAVLREAREELGYHVHNLTLAFRGFTTPGFSTEQLSLFLADYCPDDKFSRGGGLIQEGESIEVIEKNITDAFELLDNNIINDMKTALLLNELRHSIMK